MLRELLHTDHPTIYDFTYVYMGKMLLLEKEAIRTDTLVKPCPNPILW